MANIEKLGSSSPEVLLKNATNLDKLVNGRESESLPDRFGVLRKTWHGMEMIFSRFIDYITGRGEQAVAAIGWQELGNWAVGLAVDNRQQIVYYNGSWYKYLGELEHVIAGDSPENDGGVWSADNPTGKWSNIGDAALRSNLGSSEGFIWIGAPASIDGLKRIFPANGARLICKGALTENDGGASWWKFVSGDHRDMVTKYPMLCRAPLADPTGASGVWVNALDGDLLTHRFGMGISQDPVVNGEILRNLLAWNSDIEASIADGYGKKIVLCGDVIWIDYVEITQSSVHIQGAKGATANQYGGKGTVLMFRDADSTKPAFTVSGKYTTDKSTGRDKVEGRVTGVKLDNLTLVAEQFFKMPRQPVKKNQHQQRLPLAPVGLVWSFSTLVVMAVLME